MLSKLNRMLKCISSYSVSPYSDPESETVFTPLVQPLVHQRDRRKQILLFGENGVGKTNWMDALANDIDKEYPYMFNESVHRFTVEPESILIPATDSCVFNQFTLVESIYYRKLSDSCSEFIMTHGYKFIPESSKDLIELGQCFPDVIINEIPKNDLVSDEIVEDSDLCIIMADYSEISTIRSVRYWIDKYNLPPSKTVICVNKCDVQIDSYPEDFRKRKCKYLQYYASLQYPIEMTSVKTRQNLHFLYKYI